MCPFSVTIVFALLTAIVDKASADCPSLFERYCADHSYCLPANSSCNVMAYFPTPVDINSIVQFHNKYRSMIALGTQGLPPASNMMEMEWDEELAAVAQKYAFQCKYKHDLANCRQVGNFGVGQNLAIQTYTGGNLIPTPDWDFAVSIWYAEIKDFQKKDIFPFDNPKGGEYRHFTQLIWATTFRVGCGYVLYKTGDSLASQAFTILYVCNYGPSGNAFGESVYKQNNPCSDCPINSCCGSSCSYGSTYTGLCKRTDDQPLLFPSPQPNLFYCSFRNEPDCDNSVDGNWQIIPTLAGNHLEIVLNGGESSTLVFKKMVQPSMPEFCVTLNYRKGPVKYGDEEANTASEVLIVPTMGGYTLSQPLISYPNPEGQRFSTYNFTLSWKDMTQFKLNFVVPPGKPAQFFDVNSVLITDGSCQSTPA